MGKQEIIFLLAARELQNKLYVVDTLLSDSHPIAIMIKSTATLYVNTEGTGLVETVWFFKAKRAVNR